MYFVYYKLKSNYLFFKKYEVLILDENQQFNEITILYLISLKMSNSPPKLFIATKSKIILKDIFFLEQEY